MGYCAIAEIYQTDLLQYQSSRTKCWEYIQKALQLDSQNLDAMFQIVNFYMNTDCVKQAKQIFLNLVQIIIRQYNQQCLP